MFEQSLYNFEPVEPTQEGEFLHGYEIKNWDLGPRVYKIIGAAVLVNILFILIAGQGSLLTAKTCDSPLVGRVCQVLDTVYVGTMLFGTEREYVDAAYEKTELGDADITFVDVSGVEPPLDYPAGYFQIANPEQFAMRQQMAANPMLGFPGFPNPTTSDSLINTMPKLPKNNPNVIDGTLPSFDTPGDSSITTSKKGRLGGRIKKPNDSAIADNTNTAVNPTVDPIASPTPADDEAKADQFGIYLNKRPLKDKVKDTIDQVNANKVKLDNSFKVVIAGTLGLGKDGKTVILKNPKPVPVDKNIPNDPVMVKFVQDWIIAVGDTGWLGYLDKLKAKNLIITVEQNDNDLIASIRADQPDENYAKQAASGLNTLLSIAVPAAKGDEQIFLQKASVTNEGKTFVLNFSIPKPQAQEMIQRKLAESNEPKKEPSSTAVIDSQSKTATK